MTLKLKPSSVA